MPDKAELIWEPGAVDDLARLREFVAPHNPKAAANAAHRIIEAADLLLDKPFLGAKSSDMHSLPQGLLYTPPFPLGGTDGSVLQAA